MCLPLCLPLKFLLILYEGYILGSRCFVELMCVLYFGQSIADRYKCALSGCEGACFILRHMFVCYVRISGSSDLFFFLAQFPPFYFVAHFRIGPLAD